MGRAFHRVYVFHDDFFLILCRKMHANENRYDVENTVNEARIKMKGKSSELTN